MALIEVARYERRVHASGERVWENVRDWEHLPWLHRSSFRSIALRDEGDWGWKAEIGLRPQGEILLELVIHGARYVSRTLEGPGAGTEIWTRVTPVGERETDVAVSFQVPEVPPEAAESLGAGFRKLYAQLWDEDEGMMEHRTRELAARATRAEPLALGPAAKLRARLPLCVELGGRRYRVLEVGGELLAHATRCPHLLGPLDDAAVEDGVVRCPWHGYAFDVKSGRSTEGRRLRLPPAPRVEVDADGQATLVPASPE